VYLHASRCAVPACVLLCRTALVCVCCACVPACVCACAWLCACMRLCVLPCCACACVFCLPCCACVRVLCLPACVCACAYACACVRVLLCVSRRWPDRPRSFQGRPGPRAGLQAAGRAPAQARPAAPMARPSDAPSPRLAAPLTRTATSHSLGRRPPLCPGRRPHQSYVKTGRGSRPYQRHLLTDPERTGGGAATVEEEGDGSREGGDDRVRRESREKRIEPVSCVMGGNGG
jgi:hypothetical protein